MNITVEQGKLVRELSLIQGIIERKSTIPMLANVLLMANEDESLTLRATDLEVAFRSSVGAKVKMSGQVMVNARRLHEIIHRLPPGDVVLAADSKVLRVELGKIRYRLAIQDTEQFPAFREKEGSAQGVVQAAFLADQLRRVLFAVTTEDPRYSLGGAQWELENDQLTIVATDGHRLAVSRRPAQKVGAEFPTILVPRKALAEIQKLALDHEGDVYLWAEKNSLSAVVGQREIHTTLQEQRFPDYRRVIPAGNDKVFTIKTEVLKDALERVAVLSEEDSRLVRFDLKKGELKLSSANKDFGEAQEELDLDYQGESLAIGFNAHYIMQFLGVVGTEFVQVSWGKEMGQGLLEPVRPADDERHDQYVVMPMALIQN